MTDYVLVHGAWGGAWCYDPVVPLLQAAGHRVLALDLPGMGTRVAELSPAICLSDHIADVERQIAAAGFDRFVLVGHSYGGMVVTGVASRMAPRIDALVCLDAFLPEDGESLWDLTSDWEHKVHIDSQRDTPGLLAPLPGFDNPRLTRHPLLTVIEPVRLTGAERSIARRIYVFAAGWQPTPFARFHAKVEVDPAWDLRVLDCGHDVMGERPAETAAILLECAG